MADAERAVTELLESLAGGETSTFHQFIPLVYDELRVIAHRQRASFRTSDAPGTHSLVHEAYMRLQAQTGSVFGSRGQFFKVAAMAMRSILIDHVRAQTRGKRGSGAEVAPFDEEKGPSDNTFQELLLLNTALDRLKDRDPRLARIVECRFFGGLTVEETAEALDLSPATVKRGFNEARLLLYEDLRG